MSRAFVKEGDGPEIVARPAPELPPGSPNHVTPWGAARLRGELSALKAEAARLRGASDGMSAARLAQVSAEVRYLEARIGTFVETAPPASPRRAGFGTTVTLASEGGGERELTIVGVDEVDVDRGLVSWVSPLARAVIGAEVGDEVVVQTPGGAQRFEVVSVRSARTGSR